MRNIFYACIWSAATLFLSTLKWAFSHVQKFQTFFPNLWGTKIQINILHVFLFISYDFAFVDAEKRMNQEYFELLLQLVRVHIMFN